MATLNQIFNELSQFRTYKGRPRIKEMYPDLQVYTLTFTGWAGMNTLMFKSEVQSESDASKRRLVNILFKKVDFKKGQQDLKHPFRIIIADTEFFAALPTKNQEMAMRCSCEDSFYRWGHNLANHNSWIGPRPNFVVKGTGYPQNPKNKMGLCKHMWAVLQMLQQGKVLR